MYGVCPVAEATRTPDEIMLAIMQSFSSQLSGFLSLLLLKGCFEIRLPFEVSRVQHDIYLRYNPNPLLPRSHPLFLFRTTFPLFPSAPWPFFQAGEARGASKRCHRPAAGAGGATSATPTTPLRRPPPGGALLKGRRRGGEVPVAEEAGCWLTPAPLSRKAWPPVNLPSGSDRGLAPVQTLACEQTSRITLWSIS